MRNAKKTKEFVSLIEFTDNCWLWKGVKRKNYPKFRTMEYGRFGKVLAHRYAYELFRGDANDNNRDKCGKPYKLTKRKLDVIREMRRKGHSFSEIGKAVGYSKAQACRLIKRYENEDPIRLK